MILQPQVVCGLPGQKGSWGWVGDDCPELLLRLEMTDKGLEECLRITLGRKEQTQTVVDTILRCL